MDTPNCISGEGSLLLHLMSLTPQYCATLATGTTHIAACGGSQEAVR